MFYRDKQDHLICLECLSSLYLLGVSRLGHTWTGFLRTSCVWKSGWNRSCRMKIGTGTGMSQSQSKMKTVKMTCGPMDRVEAVKR